MTASRLALNTFSSLSLTHTHAHTHLIFIMQTYNRHTQHNNCLLTDSWLLSFASYTVSLTTVSGLEGYSEGKVTPVRNSGSLFACQREGHRTQKQREILYVCSGVCMWQCVTSCTFVRQHTSVEKSRKPNGEKEGRGRGVGKWANSWAQSVFILPPAFLPTLASPAASPGYKDGEDRALPGGSIWSSGITTFFQMKLQARSNTCWQVCWRSGRVTMGLNQCSQQPLSGLQTNKRAA